MHRRCFFPPRLRILIAIRRISLFYRPPPDSDCEDTADCGHPGAGICTPLYVLRQAARDSGLFDGRSRTDLRDSGIAPGRRGANEQAFLPIVVFKERPKADAGRSDKDGDDENGGRRASGAGRGKAASVWDTKKRAETARFTYFNSTNDPDAEDQICVCSSCYTGGSCAYRMKSSSVATLDAAWGAIIGMDMFYIGRTPIAAARLSVFAVLAVLVATFAASSVIGFRVCCRAGYDTDGEALTKKDHGMGIYVIMVTSGVLGALVAWGLISWCIINLALINQNLVTDSNGESLCAS